MDSFKWLYRLLVLSLLLLPLPPEFWLLVLVVKLVLNLWLVIISCCSLVLVLRKKYGVDNVIASDLRFPNREFQVSGPSVFLDVTDKSNVTRLVAENGITWIIHLGALLSAIGEKMPQKALEVNVHYKICDYNFHILFITYTLFIVAFLHLYLYHAKNYKYLFSVRLEVRNLIL